MRGLFPFHFVSHLTISLSLSTAKRTKKKEVEKNEGRERGVGGEREGGFFYDYRTAAFFDTRTTPRVMFIEIDSSLPVFSVATNIKKERRQQRIFFFLLRLGRRLFSLSLSLFPLL